MNISFKLLTLTLALGGLNFAYSMEEPAQPKEQGTFQHYTLEAQAICLLACWKNFCNGCPQCKKDVSKDQVQDLLPMICSTCSKKYSSLRALSRHAMRMQHVLLKEEKSKTEQELPCPTCKKECAQWRALNTFDFKAKRTIKLGNANFNEDVQHIILLPGEQAVHDPDLDAMLD